MVWPESPDTSLSLTASRTQYKMVWLENHHARSECQKHNTRDGVARTWDSWLENHHKSQMVTVTTLDYHLPTEATQSLKCPFHILDVLFFYLELLGDCSLHIIPAWSQFKSKHTTPLLDAIHSSSLFIKTVHGCVPFYPQRGDRELLLALGTLKKIVDKWVVSKTLHTKTTLLNQHK